MLKRLRGARNLGSPTLKTAISRIKKMSGAKRARIPKTSILTGVCGSDCGLWVIVSIVRFSAQGHHRNEDLLVCIFSLDLTCDSTFAHGDDPIADRKHFGQFGGDRDHGNTRPRHFEQKV